MSATQDRARLTPGTVFAGRFRIERVLGRGGMGVVYEAMHLHLQQPVALKVLSARDPESSARFVREAQIALALTSPNIVRVHDLGVTEGGQPFIQMELLRGRGLDKVIAESAPLSIQRAVDLVSQACLGVATAHAAGLVHRDLKPENLFLAEQEDGSAIVKVLDFGISKIKRTLDTDDLTMDGASFGTPQYMAPEQFLNAADVDGRCDQYALGLILYELLTAKRAFEGENAASLNYQIVASKIPSARAARADIPVELDEVIQKSLAKQASERFDDVAAFARAIAPFAGANAGATADEIAKVLRHPPVIATPSERGAPSTKRASPTKRVSTAGWAFMVATPLAIVVVTWAFLSPSQTQGKEEARGVTVPMTSASATAVSAPVVNETAPTALPVISAAASVAPSVAAPRDRPRPQVPNASGPLPAPTSMGGHSPSHAPIFQIPND